MLCKYNVVLKNGDEYECNECEVRNFKLFFKCVRKEIRNVVIELENGEMWIYYYGRYKWRWEIIRGGKKQLTLF